MIHTLHCMGSSTNNAPCFTTPWSLLFKIISMYFCNIISHSSTLYVIFQVKCSNCCPSWERHSHTLPATLKQVLLLPDRCISSTSNKIKTIYKYCTLANSTYAGVFRKKWAYVCILIWKVLHSKMDWWKDKEMDK